MLVTRLFGSINVLEALYICTVADNDKSYLMIVFKIRNNEK
ncbi:hypothetical protein HNR74_003483 [Flammeovirga kamogawensis]|nr:hypothetical protein [Flammeovirga kamogawensis]